MKLPLNCSRAQQQSYEKSERPFSGDVTTLRTSIKALNPSTSAIVIWKIRHCQIRNISHKHKRSASVKDAIASTKNRGTASMRRNEIMERNKDFSVDVRAISVDRRMNRGSRRQES